ncbi:transporter family-2 protein [Chitinophaga sp. CF118]|uniref:DMT family transporter n=1 Tax=Chitinophaga sp. CF118 TaxID=1884367 RepID=UPI0008EC8165|nr:DMT family transporter [Chitinophaga sp. CF118]SFE61847.1 transporter family-2 protein [Chitinophaga sp. CF118]
MERILFSVIAFAGGIFLAVQAGFNSRLGMLLKSPLLAAISASAFSFVFAVLYVTTTTRHYPGISALRTIPFYLWFIGGLFSVIGISLYYYTIPRLGISTVVSIGLCGQLLFSLFAGHLGWLNLPPEPVTLKQIAGVACLMAGILLINIK